jgi:phosphotransferase system  glucose/maltose/N-acetylglucosamine-specific IIC component
LSTTSQGTEVTLKDAGKLPLTPAAQNSSMTAWLLASMIAAVGAAVGLIHAIRDERRKRLPPASS